ncbi:DUF3270 domain-containing protein [Streptococcus dentiloxodontae]
MSDNLNRRFDYYEEIEQDVQNTPVYQEYQDLNSNSIKLQDLVFFGRLSSFCISTVLIAFLFLSAEISTFWSLFWAVTISIGLQALVQYGIKTLKAKKQA